MSAAGPGTPEMLSPSASRHSTGSRSSPSSEQLQGGSVRASPFPSPSPTRGSPGVPLAAGSPGGGPGNNNGGGAPGPPPSSSTAVTAERKRALLLEARRDRLAWIDDAASPLLRHHDLTSSAAAGTGGGPNDDNNDPMTLLGSSRACDTMKSAFDVVSALYGTSLREDDGAEGWTGGLSRSEAMERMRHQLETNVSESDLKNIISAISLDEVQDEQDTMTSRDKEFAAAYRSFVEKLKSPECADLVQGMKHFVLSFRNMADALVDKSKASAAAGTTSGVVAVENGDNNNTRLSGPRASGGGGATNESDIRELASAIHGYVGKTLDTIRTHPLWLNKGGDGEAQGVENDDKSLEMTKQVLESFVFAKCRSAVWSAISSSASDIGNSDEVMEEKLAALQFVTPSHLDIHHLLVGKDNTSSSDKEGELEPWDIALEAPIASLRAISRHHSPGMMLSCIMEAYKGVNDALSSAMVADAGADDVLPTLILSVLRAKPSQIASALKYVDLFASQQQLRGEAGYAFTNLFGAVQFIQDLDFEEHSSDYHSFGADGVDLKVKGLTIAPEEFRKGLEKCTLEAKKTRQNGESHDDGKKIQSEEVANVLEKNDDIFDIPASVVREARIRGETVDVDWARRWLEGRRAEAMKEKALKAESEEFDDERKQLPKPPPLPQGFTRSYTFLATKPEEVRVCDVPQLLQEYRMLVHATETLLSERTAKYNAEHKKHIRRMRDRLRESAGAAEF